VADRQGYDVWDKALVVDVGDDGSNDVPDVSTGGGTCRGVQHQSHVVSRVVDEYDVVVLVQDGEHDRVVTLLGHADAA